MIRFGKLALGLAAIAAASVAIPAGAQPQSAGAADTQLKSFAKATIDMRRIQKAFEEPLASETDPKGKAQLEANMQAQIVAAIKRAGLDRDSYNDIAARSHTDTALRADIEREIVALQPQKTETAGVDAASTRTALDNIAASPELAKLAELVNAAGAQSTFSAAGQFTVFAPTDSAFGLLAPGTVDTLLKPENKTTLTQILTYHVVPGAITIAELTAKVEAGGGTATLQTIEGQPLTVTKEGQAFKLTDTSGNSSYIQQADIRDSNGVTHVVNGVLVPKLG